MYTLHWCTHKECIPKSTAPYEQILAADATWDQATLAADRCTQRPGNWMPDIRGKNQRRPMIRKHKKGQKARKIKATGVAEEAGSDSGASMMIEGSCHAKGQLVGDCPTTLWHTWHTVNKYVNTSPQNIKRSEFWLSATAATENLLGPSCNQYDQATRACKSPVSATANEFSYTSCETSERQKIKNIDTWQLLTSKQNNSRLWIGMSGFSAHSESKMSWSHDHPMIIPSGLLYRSAIFLTGFDGSLPSVIGFHRVCSFQLKRVYWVYFCPPISLKVVSFAPQTQAFMSFSDYLVYVSSCKFATPVDSAHVRGQ